MNNRRPNNTLNHYGCNNHLYQRQDPLPFSISIIISIVTNNTRATEMPRMRREPVVSAIAWIQGKKHASLVWDRACHLDDAREDLRKLCPGPVWKQGNSNNEARESSIYPVPATGLSLVSLAMGWDRKVRKDDADRLHAEVEVME
jgi:hypothetical protein